MRLTREQLNNAATEMGGYTRAHMMALGEPWPLTSGWKLKILEKDFDQSAIDLFMSFSEKSKAVAFRKSQRKAAKKSRKKQAFKLYTSAENYGVSRRSKKKLLGKDIALLSIQEM